MFFESKPKPSMTRSITVIGSLLLALSAAPSMQSQSSPAQVAEEEAVRRQEATIQLRQTIAQAQAAQKKGDLVEAARVYEEGVNLLQKVGVVGVEAERRLVLNGMADVRIKLAQQAEKNGDLVEAQKQVGRVLVLDPANPVAVNYKKALDKTEADLRGRIPSREIQAMAPELQKERVETATLVQDGRALWEMGRLDEAEAKLRLATKQDPENKAAYFYLDLVNEARFAQVMRERAVVSKRGLVQVAQAWELPTQASVSRITISNALDRVHTGSGRQLIQSKLDRIVFQEVLFPPGGLPLDAVVKYLNDESRLRDPDKRGINFLINPQIDNRPPAATATSAINPATGLPEPGAGASTEPIDLYQNVLVRFSSTLRNVRLADILDAVTKVASCTSPNFNGIKYSIEEYAVVFTHRVQEQEQYFSRVFKVDPNTFIQGLQGVYATIVAGGGTGGGGVGGGGGGIGGGGGGGIGGQSGGGQGSSSGGEISSVSMAPGGGQTSGGIGGQGGGGIGGGGGGGGFGGGGGVGGGIGGQGGGGGGFGGGAGSGVPFITTFTPTSYIQDVVRQFFLALGVYFPSAGQAGGGGIGGGGGGGGGGGFPGVGGFGAGGAGGIGGLGGPGVSTVARAMFFNDRVGLLYVRATMAELDIIEQAIQTLNVAPPQVQIEVKFVEVGQDDAKALGFDWILGNTLMGSGSMGAQGGTAPSYRGGSSLANPFGIFPGQAPLGGSPAQVPPAVTDGTLTGGLRNENAGPAIGTLTGILTDPQFRVVIHALEQRGGVEVMSAPRVTTLSGRQTQIKVNTLRSIAVGVQAGATPAVAAGNVGAVGGTVAGQPNAILQPSSISLATGPTLDVVPYVSADGYTVQMTLLPSIVDFLGYGNPDIGEAAAFEATLQAQSGGLRSPVPLPRFQVRQVTTSCIVWDGQTVFLGGLLSDQTTRQRDKVPVLGDLPFFGRLFRSERSSTSKKNLVIFVTPKIIDPAGNRVHPEDNLPFDPNSIPAQRPLAEAK